MKMTTACYSSSCSSSSFQFSPFSAFNFRFSSSVFKSNSSSRRRKVALNSSHFVMPSYYRRSVSYRKSTSALLQDDGSAVEVADVDQNFAVKKKATDIASDLKGASIYLVGMNSRMKTNLGKFLAEAMRYYFFDSDKLIAEAAGGDAAAKLYRERDEPGFRESETEVLKQLSSMGRLVVSAGNGAVEGATNLSLLRHGILIWIDIPLDMVAREALEDDPSTSESHPEVLSRLTALYKEMQDGYATADASISLQKAAQKLGYDDLNDVTVEDMGLEAVKEIERLIRAKKLMEEASRPF